MTFHRVVGWAAVGLVAAVGTTGCASSGSVQAARKGDYASLKKHLAEGLQNGKLTASEARNIAYAVASHEVSSTKGEDGAKRVDEMVGCVSELESVLDDRASGKDEGAARSAYLLVDAHLTNNSRWISTAKNQDPYWRAVGARALVDSDDWALRRELFTDLDPKVRRAAIFAAIDAPSADDALVLLETVRLDPDGLSRTLAARAVGAIGGQHIVVALKDRWAVADEPLRATIAAAWAAPATLKAGGLDQLLWVAETTFGPPAITAGVALMRMGGAPGASGAAAVLRAIETGGAPSRVMAINLADLGNATHVQAIKKASEDSDGAVKVAALGKLLLVPAEKAAAQKSLGEIAASDDQNRNAARVALASVRDRRVVSLFASDLNHPSPAMRTWAAAQLASMHELPHAAQGLADDNPSVRSRIACSILSAPKKLRFGQHELLL